MVKRRQFRPSSRRLRGPAKQSAGAVYRTHDQWSQGGAGQPRPSVFGTGYGQPNTVGQTPTDGASELPEAEPWLPLMMVAVVLMGSLGVNLFLGFSYLDARHKYLSSVRRGSQSYGRADD